MSGDASAEDQQLRKEAKDHRLDDGTIEALKDYGVTSLGQLAFFGDEDFEKLKELGLPGFKISQLKDVKNKIKESQEPRRGKGINISNSTVKLGVVGEGASAGIAKLENARPDQGDVQAEGAKVEVEKVEKNATVYSVHIQNLPASPKDLKLEETDAVVDVMTDGPASVQVQPCSTEFYHQHKSSLQTVYRMNKTKRGKAAIVNVNKVEGADPREGTDIDRDKLFELFSQLHFDVTVWNDANGLRKEEIRDKLSNFAKEANEEDGQACVVCLLSHGEHDSLYGTDGKLLPFDEVFELFDDKHCPNLVGKPKIFIFQACRNGEPKIGKLSCKEGGRSDMMACFATQKGYQAFRDSKRGSWLVEAIVKIFAEFARQEEIVHMMYRVNYALQKKLKIRTAENVSPELRSTFGKKLFFFPGIQE